MALSIDPTSESAARCLQAWGVLEQRAGNLSAARRFFRSSVNVNSQSYVTWMTWATMEEDQGNSIRAEEIRDLYFQQDMMPCGGSDAVIIPIGLGGFVACRALSQRNSDLAKASRPWDMNRDGFVIGEGAGVLLAKELEHALRRGANIYAEVLGGSFTCDAYHMTEPHPEDSLVLYKNNIHLGKNAHPIASTCTPDIYPQSPHCC